MNRVLVSLAVAAFALCSSLQADWRCRCGCIVHVNYPTTCPICNRNLPDSPPPFTPPNDQVSDGSGFKLGVRLITASGGRVIVDAVLPGTPAENRLYPNDQLVKAAFRDAQNGQVYKVNIYSPDDVTRLKTMAGSSTKVAMEVFRPTSGSRNFFINFAPVGGVVTKTYSSSQGGALESTSAPAVTMTEDTTGEAAQWLNSGAGSPVNGGNSGAGPIQAPPVTNPVGGDSADSLLNGPGL